MSTQDPSGPEPEGGGQPSFDKQPPRSGGGTPEGAPSDPYGTPPPPPPPGPYGGSYGAPTGSPYGQNPYGGQSPYDQPPGYGQPGQPGYGAGPVPGMPPLGSWPNRILARLIDYLMVQAVAILVVLPFASLSDRSGSAGSFWLACGIYLIYEGLMLSRDGQTIGKKAMKIRVAMLDNGNSPTQSAAWTRAAVFVLPAVICCAGLWWLIDGLFGVFDKPYRQCLHDKAPRTVVVSTA